MYSPVGNALMSTENRCVLESCGLRLDRTVCPPELTSETVAGPVVGSSIVTSQTDEAGTGLTLRRRSLSDSVVRIMTRTSAVPVAAVVFNFFYGKHDGALQPDRVANDIARNRRKSRSIGQQHVEWWLARQLDR